MIQGLYGNQGSGYKGGIKVLHSLETVVTEETSAGTGYACDGACGDDDEEVIEWIIPITTDSVDESNSAIKSTRKEAATTTAIEESTEGYSHNPASAVPPPPQAKEGWNRVMSQAAKKSTDS